MRGRPIDDESLLGPGARSPAWLRGLLGLASVGYRAGRGLHRALYRSGLRRAVRLPVPVISVGNLTVGGVGKTPFVAWLAENLRASGRSPAVLARGYGRLAGERLNDEGRWLEQKLPGLVVVQDPDRVAAIAPVLEAGRADVVVLDDGFQHERLLRDLDLVLVDATRPFGHGRLLPRGLLRDPPSALRRADAVLLTRCELVDPARRAELEEEIERLAPGVPRIRLRFEIRTLRTPAGPVPATALRGRAVLLLCAVGNPAAVVATLRRLGAASVESITLPDHAAPGPGQLREARARADQLGAELVVTEKDEVKLSPSSRAELRATVLVQELDFEAGRPALDALLRGLLGEDARAG